MSLYLDDSGTRNPDRSPRDSVPGHGHDWFAMGGILIRDDEEQPVRDAYQRLCDEWEITSALHSSKIRARSDSFKWLGTVDRSTAERFYSQILGLVTLPSITALACVVDRPGYNSRYLNQYGRKRWTLCKTAFNIVVERAAKFARRRGCRLRVYVERGDKSADARIKGYYEELRSIGLPFDGKTSAKYTPLAQAEMRRTLFEFGLKYKSSPMIQIADLCLYPICIGGYDDSYRAYRELRDAGTLIDAKIQPDDVASEGIKYSCWELQADKTPKPSQIDWASGQPSTTTS